MEYIDSEILILEIGKHPCLYDVGHDDFKNKNIKLDAWMSVSEKLIGDSWTAMRNEEKNKIGKEIQKKWRYLKDAYIKAIKLGNRHSGSAAGSKKPYVYHKQMSFLIRTQQFQKTSCYMDKTESMPPTPQEDNDSKPSVNETTPAYVNVPQGKKRRKTEGTFKRELLSILRKYCLESCEPENPDRMFLLSLLPRVSDLSKIDKLDFQIKVMQLLQQYEHGES